MSTSMLVCGGSNERDVEFVRDPMDLVVAMDRAKTGPSTASHSINNVGWFVRTPAGGMVIPALAGTVIDTGIPTPIAVSAVKNTNGGSSSAGPNDPGGSEVTLTFCSEKVKPGSVMVTISPAAISMSAVKDNVTEEAAPGCIAPKDKNVVCEKDPIAGFELNGVRPTGPASALTASCRFAWSLSKPATGTERLVSCLVVITRSDSPWISSAMGMLSISLAGYQVATWTCDSPFASKVTSTGPLPVKPGRKTSTTSPGYKFMVTVNRTISSAGSPARTPPGRFKSRLLDTTCPTLDTPGLFCTLVGFTIPVSCVVAILIAGSFTTIPAAGTAIPALMPIATTTSEFSGTSLSTRSSSADACPSHTARVIFALSTLVGMMNGVPNAGPWLAPVNPASVKITLVSAKSGIRGTNLNVSSVIAPGTRRFNATDVLSNAPTVGTSSNTVGGMGPADASVEYMNWVALTRIPKVGSLKFSVVRICSWILCPFQ
eukprot:1856959-Rhodomonas_salina.1